MLHTVLFKNCISKSKSAVPTKIISESSNCNRIIAKAVMSQSTKRKSAKANLFETRDLIRLVKERKCLWDRFDQDYRDRNLKDAAWLEIYKAIEPDYDRFGEDMRNLIGSQITKKWYNVRDSFVKSMKHCNRNKPYIYSKLLTFLEPVYLDDKEKTEDNGDENGEQWLNEVFVIDDENESKRQKMELDRTDKEENIMSMLANLLNREEDEDRAFFTSITPAVKKLSEDSKMEFKIQVMSLLKALHGKERNSLVTELKAETCTEHDDQSE